MGSKLIYKLEFRNKKPIKFHLIHMKWHQIFTLSWVSSMAVSTMGTSGWDIWVTSKCVIKYLKNSLMLLLADVCKERDTFARHIVLQYLSQAHFCTFFIGSSKSCPDCFELRLDEPSSKGELRIHYRSWPFQDHTCPVMGNGNAHLRGWRISATAAISLFTGTATGTQNLKWRTPLK